MEIPKELELRCKEGLFISIFNTSNSRNKRVNNSFKRIYGIKRYNKIKDIIKKERGLMGIFNHPITSDLLLYALMLGVK